MLHRTLAWCFGDVRVSPISRGNTKEPSSDKERPSEAIRSDPLCRKRAYALSVYTAAVSLDVVLVQAELGTLLEAVAPSSLPLFPLWCLFPQGYASFLVHSYTVHGSDEQQ